MKTQTAKSKTKIEANAADKKNGETAKDDQQINKAAESKHILTEAETYIKDILTNTLLYQESPLDETIFQSSLVIKMEVPTEKYKKRSARMELGSIVRKFPSSFYKAFEAAYDNLFSDMEQKGDEVEKENNNDKQLLIRRFCSFVAMDKYQVLQNGFENYSVTNSDIAHPIKFHNVKKVYSADGEEQINLNCVDEATGYLDQFIICYNTLIYSLQQFCGFKVRSFLVSHASKDKTEIKKDKVREELKKIQEMNDGIKRTIYILLYLPHSLLIKAANKYHIKKQIDYAQVDPFLNDPMDSANRPIRYNTTVKNYLVHINQRMEKRKKKSDDDGKQDHLKMTDELALKLTIKIMNSIANEQKQKVMRRKTIDRKVGLLSSDAMKGTVIVNQVSLTNQQIQNYGRFNTQLQDELEKLIGLEENRNFFNDPQNEDMLTEQEKKYLFLINRGKFNPGVEKKYVQMKKKRKYFTLLHDMAKLYGYKVHDQPELFGQFQLASKSIKFFSRLEQMLLYKEIVVNPYGELALFSKMQKIKLSYLVLKQHIRVENLYMLNSKVYALTDEYEKFNKIGKKTSDHFNYQYQNPNLHMPTRRRIYKNREVEQHVIQGGLDGRNLADDWKQLFVWRTNFKTIRNYLGQGKAFQIHVKTNLILLFMYLIPIGILFEVLKETVIKPNASHTAYFPQFWFYLSYLLIVTIIYGIFTERYRRAETSFVRNFIQFNPNVDFISQYRGPYKRDILNDNANTYDQNYVSWKDTFKTCISFFIIIIFLGAEIGLYYGLRSAIVEVSYKVTSEVLLGVNYIKPIHILFYTIFFFQTAAFYNFFLVDFARWLTNFQNRPTKQAYIQSENLKLYIYAIGVEMIAPIDLVFIQSAAKTSCLAGSCAYELQDYINARYLVILFFAILSTINMIRKFIQKKRLTLPKLGKTEIQMNYSRKLALFLQFVYEESLKEPSSDIKLIDETVALVQFATYLTGLPFGALISFVAMMADYNIQRQIILNNQQRPIPKSEGFQTYRKIIVAIGHWMLFFNFSQMFLTLEWLQYLFPNVILALSDPPTTTSIVTIKYITIVLFMLLYQIIMAITVKVVSRTHSVLDKRKWNMFQKHSLKILNLGENIQLNKPEPLHSISRTFNLQKKGQNELQMAQNLGTSSQLNMTTSINKSKAKNK